MAIASAVSAQFGMAEEAYTDEVQRISGTPDAPVAFGFDGAVTEEVPVDASAGQVQAALEALPNIGTGGVTCTGGPLPTAIDITFTGPAVGKRDVPELTVANGVNDLTITTVTPGKGYGDAATVTRFLDMMPGESLQETVEYITSQGLRAGGRMRLASRQIRNSTGAGGSIPFEVSTKGFGMLFKHMLGSVTIGTPDGGTLTRDHTYTLGDLCHMSLTMQKGVPRAECVASNVDAYTFVGCRITEWTMACELNGLLTLNVTVDARRLRTDVPLAAASYASGMVPLSSKHVTITVDGATAAVSTFSLTGTNPQDTERRFLGRQELKAEPLINDFAQITGNIQMDYSTPALAAYEKWRSGATAEITALFESDDEIEPGFKYGVLLTLPACRFTGQTPTINDPGIVRLPLPFEVLSDGTNEPITIRYRTTDTAV